MNKGISIKILSTVALMAVVWGCMQVDKNSDNQAQTQQQYDKTTNLISKIAAGPKSLAKKSSTNPCSTVYSDCMDALDDDTYCSQQEDQCLQEYADVPSACLDAQTALDLSPCLSALGVCQGFIDIYSDAVSCLNTDCQNPPASILNFASCVTDKAGGNVEEVFQNPLTALSIINECACGAGGGSVFGNYSTLVSKAFTPSSSPGGTGFTPSSSPGGTGFTPSSSPGGAGFTPSSSPGGAGFKTTP